ncbi:MAG: four helix bundle protein [Nitrospiria bacterium]
MAETSLYELKSHLLIAKGLGFGTPEEYRESLESIEKLSVQLNNLIASTRKRGSKRG